jgi:putative membrane protein
MRLLIGWAVNALCLLAIPYILPGVQISGFMAALIAALVIGLLNIIIKPILFVLTLPVSILTLGLFTFVLNGLMFWLAAKFLDGFAVTNFGWAIAGAFAYTLISWAVSTLLMPNKAKEAVKVVKSAG